LICKIYLEIGHFHFITAAKAHENDEKLTKGLFDYIFICDIALNTHILSNYDIPKRQFKSIKKWMN